MEKKFPVLEVKGLKKHFPLNSGIVLDRVIGWIKALDGVDISLDDRDILGLVGESGSGKSTLAKAILLLEKASEGEILFQGKNVNDFNAEELKLYRQRVQAVFQDPYSSLSPRMKLLEIISEPLIARGGMSKQEMEQRVTHALQTVGLSQRLIKVHPHELSGGQRQRVAIARAISTEATTIILDEPTSALDVSVRLQIVNLLMELHEKLGLSYLLIGHDLSMVSYMSTRIAVMYLGKIMELAETTDLLENTAHPYTRALISASLPDHPREKKDRIRLPGEIANPFHVPKGCRFHPRCLEKKAICSEEEPPLRTVGNGHLVACHL